MKKTQLTLLIVDDSLEDRATYRRYLQQDSRYSYKIFEEEYGEKALETCKQIQPDVILLDFLLPDTDGLEFLSELKVWLNTPNLPVVMLTGRGTEAIAVQAIKSGAQDYLVKGDTTSESLRLAVHSVVERSQLLWQLKQSEERFRTSVENMLVAFGIYSAIRNELDRIVDFRIEYVNAAACQTNHLTKQELIGKSLCELLPAHREGLFDEYCQVIETGKPLIKESFLYSDSCGDRHVTGVFDIRVAKLGDGLVASWQDVTERKRLEAERNKLLAQEQAARAEAETANQAKDSLLAMVSHDLKNPLSAILSYSRLLQTRKLDEATAMRALKSIENSARLQNQLIDDLLDFSHVTLGQLRLDFQPVNLIPIIQAAIDTLFLTAQAKEIQIETYLNLKAGKIRGDATRLQQVMWNLLSNAIKFTPQGGLILVRLEEIQGEVLITVSDTGKGIKPEFLPYVFERFRQADENRRGGLGLGLAIVRHLVELHTGTVQAASAGEGQGATFTVKLPLTFPAEASREATIKNG